MAGVRVSMTMVNFFSYMGWNANPADRELLRQAIQHICVLCVSRQTYLITRFSERWAVASGGCEALGDTSSCDYSSLLLHRAICLA